MIQFAIRLFKAVTGSPRHVAQVQPRGTLTLDQLIDSMQERNPVGGRPATLAVLENFFAVCQDRTLEGYHITTPYFNTRLSVKGEFDGPDDGFLAGRNAIRFSASPGIALTQALGTARVEKLESQLRVANATQYMDVATGFASTTLTKGGLGRITGKRLKIGSRAGEGLFLMLPNGTAVQITQLATNRPSELVFQLPSTGLTVGQQVHFEVRNHLNDTPELRISRLAQPLIVA
jgi:hypothetical protein